MLSRIFCVCIDSVINLGRSKMHFATVPNCVSGCPFFNIFNIYKLCNVFIEVNYGGGILNVESLKKRRRKYVLLKVWKRKCR